MKTYTVYTDSNAILADHVGITSAMQALPAGSRLCGGGPEIEKETGKLLFCKATFRHRGRHIYVVEDGEKK